MTTEQAVLELRADPKYADLVRDAYLGPDVLDNAKRFFASGEFAASLRLIRGSIEGRSVLDLGAGTGIASYAFARAGAREVVALEPDPSDVVGQGAIRRISVGLPIAIATGFGEALPFLEGRFDVVYARQVLHHARDLRALLRECARVTVKGGTIVAAREHVVDDPAQLSAFLASHPVHRLAGGEHAYSLTEYMDAFARAGLQEVRALGPFDSVVNAFPAFDDDDALRNHPRALLARRLGRFGGVVAAIPGATALVRRIIDRPVPGRLYTFIVTKT